MIQEILVIGLFIVAIGYVGNILWKSLSSDSNCKTGCASCSPQSIKKLQKQFIKAQKGKF